MAANEGITLDADGNPKEPIDACDGSIYTLRILPFHYYLRGGFHREYGGTTPEGVHRPKPYSGKWFENPNLVEGLEREVQVPAGLFLGTAPEIFLALHRL